MKNPILFIYFDPMTSAKNTDPEFKALIDESIRLELNVGKLYLLFYEQFKGDSQFWWKLTLEEENHAALLKTVKQMGSLNVDIPGNLLPERLEELVKSNQEISAAYNGFQNHPDRTRAFQFALKIENSAGEIHYNAFMVNKTDSNVGDLFKKLNRMDVDHAERIRQYMLDHGIPLKDQ
ncbi:MAG: rubrerythrin family protein [Bacteroidota bacterium]